MTEYKSRRNDEEDSEGEVDDDEREEVRFKTTKASKYKYKSKRVSDKDDDDDEEEECRLKSKKASSIKESRGEYEAVEEEEEEEEEGIGAGGRRLLVSPAVYRDNRLSKGGHAKEKGCVERGRPFKKVTFKDESRCLIGKGLTRNLCYWLMTRVDVPNRIFISVDGKEFPLTKVQVHWVMGLPIGPNVLPEGDEKGSLKEDVRRLWSKYSSKAPLGAAGISRKNVVDVLLSDDVTEKDFKECFVLLALMDVLCPTTCHRMSSKLLPYVFYLDKLKRQPTQWGVFPRPKSWSKKEMNKARACDELSSSDYGKLGVVDVAYGENHPLDCRDSMPGIWSGNFQSHMMTVDDLLNLIRSMGNVNYEAGSSSSRCYENASDASRAKKGGNRCRKDVKNPWQHKQDKESRERESLTPLPREQENHYSEEQNNDMVIKQDIVDSVVKNVCHSVTNKRDVGSSGSKGMFFEEDGIRYEWGTTGMVCSRVDGGVGDIRDGDVSQNEGNLGLGGGLESDLDVGEGAGDVVGVDGGVEMNVDDDGVGGDDSEYRCGAIVPVGGTMGGQRSRVQRKSRARTRMRSEYKHPLLKTIADFILHYGGLSPHNQSTFDPVVIRCCGEDATFRVVSTVISPIVCFIFRYSMVYVRVVAMMYGRVWAKRYEGRSRRIMLDPAFAVAIGSYWESHHESVSASDVIQRTVARIQDKDRIPTYSVNMRRSWLLKQLFPKGQVRFITYQWANWYETGVVMLEVVKECSDRLLQSYDVGGFAEQRLRLLCDDITCDFNEVKHETKAFLNSWRIRRSRN
ncbi:hypothetical protein RDABS01_025045 [Bienertia sinuspersici]